MRDRGRQHWRKIFLYRFVRRQPQRALVEGESCVGGGLKFNGAKPSGGFGGTLPGDHDNLDRTFEKVGDGDSVSRGEDAELLCYAREGFQRLLRLLAITGVAGVVMQAQQR